MKRLANENQGAKVLFNTGEKKLNYHFSKFFFSNEKNMLFFVALVHMKAGDLAKAETALTQVNNTKTHIFESYYCFSEGIGERSIFSWLKMSFFSLWYK